MFLTNNSMHSKLTKQSLKVGGKLLSDTNLIMSVSNFAVLSLGRLVFLPYQRRQTSNAGLPLQNGETHAVAGDRLAQEASFVAKSADPAGFNTIDVLAWGSIGHVLGFTALVLTQ